MSRDLYQAWTEALLTFIYENRVFPLGSDVSKELGIHLFTDPISDCQKTLERIKGRGLDYVLDEDWLIKTKVLALFLHRAPLMRDVVRPIAWTDANISRQAMFDPLTYNGFHEVHHFTVNGLFDDDWIALYSDGTDRRIVGEWIDDFVTSKNDKMPPATLLSRLDKSIDWLKSVKRTYLYSDSVTEALLSDLTEDELLVPTQDQLFTIWATRPYDDFCSLTLVSN